MLKALAVLSVLLLAACGSTQGEVMKRTVIVCQGWAGAFSAMTSLRIGGRLTEDQVGFVNEVRPMFDGACHEGAAATDTITLDALEGYLLTMAIMQKDAAK